MTHLEFGARRDGEIIAFVSRWHYVLARQVARAVMHGRKHPATIARQRLRALCKRGPLHRYREPEGFVYSATGKRSAKWQHWVALCDLYLDLQATGALVEFAEEWSMPGGQADARAVIRENGKEVECFFEIERTDAFDRWDLYQGRLLCLLTTPERAKTTRIPAGVKAGVGVIGENPLTVLRRGLAHVSDDVDAVARDRRVSDRVGIDYGARGPGHGEVQPLRDRVGLFRRPAAVGAPGGEGDHARDRQPVRGGGITHGVGRAPV